MLHASEDFSRRVEQAVADIEKHTAAEVVVVAAERSGHYRDIALQAATAVTTVVLAILLALPYIISEPLLLLDLAVVFAVGAWFFDGIRFIRLLASRDRKRTQVRDAAAMEFTREAVHATPDRTGILIYVSALEGLVEIVPDVGLEAKIPRGRWAAAAKEFRHDDLEHFLSGLTKVGELLAEHVPPREDGAADVDLPNAPRIR